MWTKVGAWIRWQIELELNDSLILSSKLGLLEFNKFDHGSKSRFHNTKYWEKFEFNKFGL